MSSTEQNFDLVIIGAGPGGYTGAIRAAQLGMKVAVVEKNPNLGGTCLNVGCIPSKSLLDFSHKYEEAKNRFSDIGIEINGDIKINCKTLMNKKNSIIEQLSSGIEILFKKNKIARFIGIAKILDKNTIQVTNSENVIEKIKTSYIIIATGSDVIRIPEVDIDEKSILSSTGALSLQKIPKELVIVGGGYIGLEMGSIWNRFGSKVTIVEFTNSIVPQLDQEIATKLKQNLEKQGIKFLFNTKVTKAKNSERGVVLEIESSAGEKQTNISSEIVLVAIGRKPYIEGLGLEELGIKLDKNNRILTDKLLRTNIENIYAIGDVVFGPMLAHKAEDEAIAAVENIKNKSGHVNYHLIPSVIYTHPEVASIGYNEEEIRAKGINYKVGKFSFAANSRAKAVLEDNGMVKMLTDEKTDEILGCHIIGPDAGGMICEILAYMEFGASAEDVARSCHPHPTFNEAIKEAAMAIDNRSINS